MRWLLYSILTLFLTCTYAEEFSIFEKDGFFGIKNNAGEVLVPATYQQLGWSNGSSQINDEIIGYKEGSFWGLITARNKVLTAPKFYSIEPFDNNLIKVSIKGKFSNQLFHGLLNNSGKIEVSCNYFTLEKIGSSLLVSEYEGRLKYGVISYANKLLIPLGYERITSTENLFSCVTASKKIDLFTLSGEFVYQGIDSLIAADRGYVGYKHGLAGFVLTDGTIKIDFDYKTIESLDGALLPFPYPTWSIYHQDELQFQTEADSVHVDEGLVIAYRNGAQHLSIADSSYQYYDLLLLSRRGGHFIFKNSNTQKWCVLDERHAKVLDGYDSIITNQKIYWAKDKNGWKLFDRAGKKKSRLSFQKISKGHEDQFLAKLSGHWGLINPLGESITPFKYDSIQLLGEHYEVSYLNRTGVMARSGRWLLRPEYQDVFVFDQLLVGKKGFSYAYHDSSGALQRSTAKPIKRLGKNLLVELESFYGLMDQQANYLIYPEYDEIEWRNGYYILKKEDQVTVTDNEGITVFSPELGLQEVGGMKEDFFLIKKNNRWGFVDFKGRLRISNRYDSAGLFSEGLAPVFMRKKWGFIDKDENLTTQPYYDEVSPFQNGLSIVREGFRYGLIDKSGREVVAVKWKELKLLPSGNYLFVSDFDQMGLISSSGEILLSPSFDLITDSGGKVIVSNHDKKGLLDYDGNQLFRIEHREILISNDYTLIKH